MGNVQGAEASQRVLHILESQISLNVALLVYKVLTAMSVMTAYYTEGDLMVQCARCVVGEVVGRVGGCLAIDSIRKHIKTDLDATAAVRAAQQPQPAAQLQVEAASEDSDEQLIEDGRNLIFQEVIQHSNEEASYNTGREEIIAPQLNELY